MAKLKRNHFTGLSNIFGGKGKNLADLMNEKIDPEALETVDTIADTATATATQVADKVNELITALKTNA